MTTKGRRNYFLQHHGMHKLCYSLYILFCVIVFGATIFLLPAFITVWVGWYDWRMYATMFGFWLLIPIVGIMTLTVGHWWQGFDEADKEYDRVWRDACRYPNPDPDALRNLNRHD